MDVRGLSPLRQSVPRMHIILAAQTSEPSFWLSSRKIPNLSCSNLFNPSYWQVLVAGNEEPSVLATLGDNFSVCYCCETPREVFLMRYAVVAGWSEHLCHSWRERLLPSSFKHPCFKPRFHKFPLRENPQSSFPIKLLK